MAPKRKTHCPAGHEYDRKTKEGWRRCGTCAKAALNKRRSELREAWKREHK